MTCKIYINSKNQERTMQYKKGCRNVSQKGTWIKSVFRTQSNLCDGAFFAKIVNSF